MDGQNNFSDDVSCHFESIKVDSDTLVNRRCTFILASFFVFSFFNNFFR